MATTTKQSLQATSSKAAQVSPASSSKSRTEQYALSEKSKTDVMDTMQKHAERVVELAKKYAETKDEKTRLQLNKENLHLNGEIHVISRLFGDKEKQELFAMQIEANKAIEAAAKEAGKSVVYLDINGIKSKDGKTAPEYIHEKLFNHEHADSDKFISSIENKILEELKNKGFEEQEFLRRLFVMKMIMRKEGGVAEKEIPAAQVEESQQKSADEVKKNSRNLETETKPALIAKGADEVKAATVAGAHEPLTISVAEWYNAYFKSRLLYRMDEEGKVNFGDHMPWSIIPNLFGLKNKMKKDIGEEEKKKEEIINRQLGSLKNAKVVWRKKKGDKPFKLGVE